MRRRRDHLERERPRLEIVPMIDIMMFLLVFFVMIVLKMIPDSGVALKLPGAQTAKEMKPAQVVVMIDAAGKLHVKNQVVTLAGLQTYLGQVVAAKRKVDVVIAGDKDIRYQRLMQVMDTVRKSGIVNVGLATKRPGG
ncbi:MULTISPECIES: biopolymer transporter ExbD [Acidiphilium]|jgi:biopolymer transport protein ExbD|uniref:Outer membrane transport energization protein ExbD n=1 Tax=Acidiphilium cryptum (strain JF-5) TaxID=349163 RepID=A5FXS0_ACICJ|nr:MULTISPECIES: biopolymer transporter ExbD [Acidiphilium]MBU6356946.1 biopolymer transporter ExbD [Rhodospirillales bacterium]ABQ30402.1 outer membrane transport energization protein ExbD [Acidiphilium cryptum JF-5]EGO93541.1 Biopolymer transport protein ExbD/TolR [Acidiphilium sp. PM]MDE2327024.1 biopolymer transporter ExbD [Rhodospirillales bacterium]UNC12903.1 biopolymer transporter ExbD [Acidiphilium multivorum]